MRLKLGNVIWSALVILSWLALSGGIAVGLAQPPNSIGADAALFLIILTVAAFVLWLLGRFVVWAWRRTFPRHPGAELDQGTKGFAGPFALQVRRRGRHHGFHHRAGAGAGAGRSPSH
jgi:hypothetical protein